MIMHKTSHKIVRLLIFLLVLLILFLIFTLLLFNLTTLLLTCFYLNNVHLYILMKTINHFNSTQYLPVRVVEYHEPRQFRKTSWALWTTIDCLQICKSILKWLFITTYKGYISCQSTTCLYYLWHSIFNLNLRQPTCCYSSPELRNRKQLG